ncbi:MAG: glycoside hydrolase family 97 N-terminal domain-containing protein, partial [Draconibacterium sp.]|nr:glycoside hydrolase family 97 N-terminal domain-containing protein [Draconibacterium sp.]
MKKVILKLIVLILFIQPAIAKSYQISSPDKRLQLTVQVDESIIWSATLDGNEIISKVEIGMDFSEGTDFGIINRIKKHTVQNVSAKIFPGISHKDSEIIDEYEELVLTFKDDYKINFRAYNDGVAYQFVDNGKLERNVINEKMTLVFPEGSKSLFPQEKSMYSGNERF